MCSTTAIEGDPHEYLHGEMWCYGFMNGIGVSPEDWRPLLDDPDGARLLRPIRLLGADEVSCGSGKKFKKCCGGVARDP